MPDPTLENASETSG